MRIRIMAAAAGLAALPAMAGVPMPQGAAASPVSTQPLAANEVLVELSATGEATSRADLATLTYSFMSRGATEADARRAHDARVARLREAGRAAGAEIEVADPVSLGPTPDDAMTMDTIDMAADAVEAAADAVETAADEAPEEPPIPEAVQGTVTFRIRDIDRVDPLNQALIADGAQDGFVPEVAYSVGDDSGARRRARADAITIARADAEAYAAAMGMRVARIVRVSERSGMDLMSLMFSNPVWAQQIEQLGQPQGPDISVRVIVGVDFALAPR
jgi:uncharacterized protein YggE